MNVLVLGLNYAPEQVGIAPYTTGMAEALVAAGHRVTVVAGQPYYPAWTIDPAHAGPARATVEQGVRIVRLPLYVPRVPDGKRRLLHHASFAARALPALLAEVRRQRPDVVIAIAPSLIAVPAARIAARVAGAPLWLHVQDFEVEAAFATGLLAERGGVARAARAFERRSLGADRVSTISPQMRARLIDHGIPADRAIEFRNWAEIHSIAPLGRPSAYRAEWGIDRAHVALYSGNIANKQGIELVVEAARRLAHRRDLAFVVCGEGPNRARLMEAAAGLDGIMFHDLQPRERLGELLGLATVHLLPQIAGAADLVLPSKLANMLASGRPVVATAAPGTGLAAEVEGCGLVTPPGDGGAFAAAIERLIDDPPLRASLGAAARRRAEARWSRAAILTRFEAELRALVERRG